MRNTGGQLTERGEPIGTPSRNIGSYTAEAYGYRLEFLDYMKNIPIKAERGSASGRALVEGRVVHITDAAADPEYRLVEARRLGDYRTILCDLSFHDRRLGGRARSARSSLSIASLLRAVERYSQSLMQNIATYGSIPASGNALSTRALRAPLRQVRFMSLACWSR